MPNVDQIDIAIIGGSGLNQVEWADTLEERSFDTPFGKPSAPITIARAGDATLGFLPRHGVNHEFLPSEVNSCANIYALKSLGAKWCIGIGAVGSLQEELRPGDAVIPDQIIDRTSARRSTFFGDGMVAHINFADPFCPVLRESLASASRRTFEEAKRQAHTQGTYLCMEGPALSTRAESHLYRSWNASIIGMTVLPEAKLAREAEMAYGTLALVTDYDCWRSQSAEVDVPEIFRIMEQSTNLAKQVIKDIIPVLLEATSPAHSALEQSLVTPLTTISEDQKKRLGPIIGRYL